MSKPASVQKIKSIIAHPNADRLEVVELEGMAWKVVSQKDIHAVGDMVCYVENDTRLDEKPWNEFLRSKKFMVKPIKLRGVHSVGLILPLLDLAEELNGDTLDLTLGKDISDQIGASHYEKPLPLSLGGEVVGHYPSIVPKTDEDNLLSNAAVFEELVELPCVITLKVDGSSFGMIKHPDGKVEVCSRNLSLKETEGNTFWKIYHKYGMDKIPNGIALNGEVYGPGVNGNNLGETEHKLAAFNMYNLNDGRHLVQHHVMAFECDRFGVPVVKVLYKGTLKEKFKTIQDLIDFANIQKYPNGKAAEGIVIRPLTPRHSETLNKNLSVKVISENYKD